MISRRGSPMTEGFVWRRSPGGLMSIRGRGSLAGGGGCLGVRYHARSILLSRECGIGIPTPSTSMGYRCPRNTALKAQKLEAEPSAAAEHASISATHKLTEDDGKRSLKREFYCRRWRGRYSRYTCRCFAWCS